MKAILEQALRISIIVMLNICMIGLAGLYGNSESPSAFLYLARTILPV